MKDKFKLPNISQMERQEKTINHFARGINFYKLFWIFFIGCFLGVVIETIWCMCTRLQYESRVGLIYGPFNLVYGFGTVAMAIGLYGIRNKKESTIFVGGVIIGSIVEYICSVIQQMLFGAVSWDYSKLPFNLNGRVNLLYSFFWGILALIWIKGIYPILLSWIVKIPNKIGKILTWLLLVFMIFNTIMSALAVERWTQRRAGEVAENHSIWVYFDQKYTDERMERLYPNMIFEK
ncbi:MAG: putative ABC transporter permease [Cellulosilyticaceae bacterium]